MNKKLYLFDFDGTISNKDSFIDFLLKSFDLKTLLFKLTSNLPRLTLVFLKNKEISKLKECILSIFFKGMRKNEIEEIGKKYSKLYINRIVRPKAIEYIEKIKREENCDIYIVSASLHFWLHDFSKNLKVNLIATKLYYKNGVFTGFFNGKNCKGIEKVKRIKKEINLNLYEEIISFGNSKGDLEMFNISTVTHYKPFRENL